MAGILAWFWNERFWLPHNVTWADLKNTDEATFPQAEDLYLACPLAFCIFMIRLVFERWVWAHAVIQVAVMRVVMSMKYSREWCSTARLSVLVSVLPKQWHLIGLAHKSPLPIVLLSAGPAALRAVCNRWVRQRTYTVQPSYPKSSDCPLVSNLKLSRASC